MFIMILVGTLCMHENVKIFLFSKDNSIYHVIRLLVIFWLLICDLFEMNDVKYVMIGQLIT